jgi:heme A synthase
MKGTNWDTHLWIHRINAMLIIVIVFIFALIALYKMKWKFLKDHPHAYFAVVVLGLVFFIAIMGVITRSMLRRNEWSTRSALRMKLAHIIVAYTIIVVALFAIWFGIYDYRTNPKHDFDFPLEWVVIFFAILTFVIIELIYQRSLHVEDAFFLPKVEDGV